MKHTPGPWQFVGKPNLYECLKNAEGTPVIVLIDDYDGYPECGQDLRMDVEDQDAHLIAAAPDMYEALREIDKLNILDRLLDYADSDTEAEDYHYAMRCVQSALAKARGEQ